MMRVSLAGFALFLVGCAAAPSALAQDWVRSALPPAPGKACQPGVARPFYGVTNGVFILAGGTNFPAKPPAEGGAQVCRDEIYVLDTAREWHALLKRLPDGPVAEGISVTTPLGIACLGGTDGQRDLDAASLMFLDPAAGEVKFSPLPPLPKTLCLGVGGAWKNQIFVASGRQGGVVANGFWRLDLDRLEAGWIALPPVPGVAREQAVGAVAVRSGGRPAFFVFGGNGIGPDGRPTALLDGYLYDLTAGDSGAWKPAAPVRPIGAPKPISVLGASAVSVRSRIICAGGFDKDLWDEAAGLLGELKGEALAAFREDYLTRPVEAYRWNRRLLVYDSEKNVWRDAGEVPEARCGAAMAFLPDYSIIIASGEDKPGSRTAGVLIRKLPSRMTR
jgi:N-acetylneuraminate epimerase